MKRESQPADPSGSASIGQGTSASLSASQDASRRGFIKNSSLLVVGGTVAGGLSLARSAHAFGSDTIRVGLVGCGARGRAAIAEALRADQGARLVAVADVFEHQVRACLRGLSRQARQLDVPPERQFVGLTGYQPLLQTACDVVILATPPGFRPLHLEAAVAARKHVFMEKPVAVDASGVLRVLRAAREARDKDLAIAVGLQRRHEPRYQQTIRRLQDGMIGNILLARVYWNGNGSQPQPRRAHDSELTHQLRNWPFFTWLSGDPIVEQHVHNLDVINWLQQDHPVMAQGIGGRAVRTGPEYGQAYDHYYVEYTYADGCKLLSQCRQIPGCWNSVSEHVHGQAGTADISGGRIKDAAGKTLWQFGKGGARGWQEEQHHLFAGLRSGRLPREAEYAAMSTLTAVLGRVAIHTGQPVTWDEVLRSGESLAMVDHLVDAADPAPVVPDASGVYPAAGPKDPRIA